MKIYGKKNFMSNVELWGQQKSSKFSGIEIRKQKEIHPSEWIQPWNLEPAFIVMGRIRGLVGVVTITKNECI
jgi:hypothetical protein